MTLSDLEVLRTYGCSRAELARAVEALSEQVKRDVEASIRRLRDTARANRHLHLVKKDKR